MVNENCFHILKVNAILQANNRNIDNFEFPIIRGVLKNTRKSAVEFLIIGGVSMNFIQN